jgi:hypothetical protein
MRSPLGERHVRIAVMQSGKREAESGPAGPQVCVQPVHQKRVGPQAALCAPSAPNEQAGRIVRAAPIGRRLLAELSPVSRLCRIETLARGKVEGGRSVKVHHLSPAVHPIAAPAPRCPPGVRHVRIVSAQSVAVGGRPLGRGTLAALHRVACKATHARSAPQFRLLGGLELQPATRAMPFPTSMGHSTRTALCNATGEPSRTRDNSPSRACLSQPPPRDPPR